MSATGHSAFPASAAYRLLACPGSYAAAQAVEDGTRRSTIFSAEGTLAHSISEAAIFAGAEPADTVGRTFSADGFQFTPDEDFTDAVSTYVDFVRGLRALGYLILLETRVSPMIHWEGLADLGVDLFGTADCIAFHPGTGKLVIVDLKFGRGIAVEVEGNPQLLYYGAGAFSLDLLNFLLSSHGHGHLPEGWQPSSVETIVVQPRAPHPDGPIRKASYTGAEIADWARVQLYEGVRRAVNDNGKTLKPGDHCRFCPANTHCKALDDLTTQAARAAFAAVPALNVPMVDTETSDDPNDVPLAQAAQLAALPETHISNEKLGEMLDKIAILKPYFAALEALGVNRINEAREVPGWKVVPTRTRRVWQHDEADIVAAMHNAGVAPGQYTETRLRSPAQTEKMLGKKQFKALNDALGLVTQSKPGQQLAPEGDPRGRVEGARTPQEAFGLPAPTKP